MPTKYCIYDACEPCRNCDSGCIGCDYHAWMKAQGVFDHEPEPEHEYFQTTDDCDWSI